jgi:hypothetical protein
MTELTLEQVADCCAQLVSLVDESSRSNPYALRRAQELLEHLSSVFKNAVELASPIAGKPPVSSMVVEARRKIARWFDPVPWANAGPVSAGEQANVRELIQCLELAALRNLTESSPH